MVSIKEWFINQKHEFQAGLVDGVRVGSSPDTGDKAMGFLRSDYFPVSVCLIIFGLILLAAFTISPADAYPSKYEVMSRYATGYSYKQTWQYVPSLYSFTQPVKSVPLPQPIAPVTVSNTQTTAGVNDCSNRYYQIMIYGNCIPQNAVEDAIKNINPFFHYSIVPVSSSAYLLDGSGEPYSRVPYTILFVPTSGQYRGNSRGKGCITIYIPPGFAPSTVSLKTLITHECCHEIQTTGNIDARYPLDQCIKDYTAECLSWSKA